MFHSHWLVNTFDLQVVSLGRKRFSADFQLMFRLLKLFVFIGFVVTIAILFIFLNLTVGDIFISLLAFLPTGWALLMVRIWILVCLINYLKVQWCVVWWMWCVVVYHDGADITSMQASGEGHRNVGVYKSSSKRVRIRDGTGYLYPSGCHGMVPLCHRVPGQAAIQPSFQSRASDPTYSFWWEEAEV